MKRDLLKFPLDIQFFATEAEETTEETNEDTGTEEKDQEEKKSEEKTFTQAEVNQIVQERLNREKKSSEKVAEETKEEDVKIVPQDNPFIEKYAQAEIKVAMTQNGIDASKVNRAVRLIDHKNVLTEEGDVDVEKLNSAITDLLKDWPELAPKKEENLNGFKIGSDNQKNKGDEEDVIAKAFRNNK